MPKPEAGVRINQYDLDRVDEPPSYEFMSESLLKLYGGVVGQQSLSHIETKEFRLVVAGAIVRCSKTVALRVEPTLFGSPTKN